MGSGACSSCGKFGIIPLGTGNDPARSFSWSGRFISFCLEICCQRISSQGHYWSSELSRQHGQHGFVEAHVDGDLLEFFGLRQGRHTSFVMAAAIRLQIKGGEWKDAFVQMDGEPWKQPLNWEYTSFVEIWRVPHQSLMINGE